MGPVAPLVAHCFGLRDSTGAALVCRVSPAEKPHAIVCYEVIDGDGTVAVVRYLLHRYPCTEAMRFRIKSINLPKGVH